MEVVPMQGPLEFLRRIARRFVSRDVLYPARPQPLYDVEGLYLSQEDIAREYADAIRERYGPLPVYEGQPFKFVIRETQFAGNDPSAIKVPSEYFLTGHFTVVGTDGVVQQVVLSSASGQTYDPSYFDRALKGKMGYRFDNKQAMYDYLESAVTRVDWYLTRFIPK